MRAQQNEPHRLGRGARQHVLDGEDIAEALRHLFAVHAKHAIVNPIAGKAAAGKRAQALRAFVLVVREQQIPAAAVDVERLAEIAPGHGAALDVPARPTAPPGTVPARQVGRGRLPEHEVAGIALVRRHLDARAGQQLVWAAAGEPAVFGEASHCEQHMAFDRIGMTAGDQPLDQRDHLRDMPRGARLHLWRIDAERGERGVIAGGGARGDRVDRLAGLGGARVNLVVHVGDVADVGEARIEPAQQPRQHVEHDGGAGVAEMRHVVHRRPAHVHADMRGVERDEPLAPPAHAVVQVEVGHRCLLVPPPMSAGRRGKSTHYAGCSANRDPDAPAPALTGRPPAP